MVNSGALRYIHDIKLRDQMADYRGQIESFKDYNSHILQSIISNTFEVARLEDLHDLVSADTTETYIIDNHLPALKPFEALSDEQRNLLVFFYEGYVVQTQSDLVAIRRGHLSGNFSGALTPMISAGNPYNTYGTPGSVLITNGSFKNVPVFY